MGLKPSTAVYLWTLKPSASDFKRLFCDGIVNVYVRGGLLRSRVLIGQKFGKGVLCLYCKHFYKKGRYITMTI